MNRKQAGKQKRKMNTGKRIHLCRILPLLVMLVLVWAVSAGGTAFAADRNVEWGCYQNSAANNGVIGQTPLPESYDETALKWERKMVSGFTTSFTPPLIIDGSLYTASNTHVYRINKENGEIQKESAKLKLDVGYAMNPITYDESEDQLYVPIRQGRVECLDAETLQSKWISDEHAYMQTLSPISCRDGLIYTGIWETETHDGAFLCLDADTGETVWSYIPSVNGASLGDFPHGFYWAGAYVDDDYVVVGSDDGAANTFAEAGAGVYPETAVVYCFDRRTGDVVDRITGVKGDIRSTVVYDNGHIYFVSKGGRLYKTTLGANGHFSNTSFIQLKTGAGTDALTTSTPVIYNGRIYVGAAGSGGQFNADGGHMFAVIRDDAALSDSSLIYTVPVSGYPQAAPLLSTATEQTDGKVRLYFTFNAFPGGIYCLEDSASMTASNHGKAELLFRPEKELQQYCISPLCCDREGTIYYKNDSGHLMAVALNKAYLNDISIQYGGREISWNTPFETGTLNYRLQAPNGAAAVDVRLNVPGGMTVQVDGRPWNGSKISVALKGEETAVPVTVSKKEGGRTYTRTYTLRIGTLSNNADLAGLIISASNTKPSEADWSDAGNSGIGYDPGFNRDITEYVGRTFDGKRDFLNLWLRTDDPKAAVRVIPTDNVGNSAPNFNMNEDGTLAPASTGYYPVYWVMGETSAEVDVEVTSPSGKETKVYHVTLVRSGTYIDTVGKIPMKLTPSSLTLYTSGSDQRAAVRVWYNKTDVTGQCTWETTDPGVATVSPNGEIMATGEGEAEVWVRYPAQNRRARVHVEVTNPVLSAPEADIAPGEYYEPLRVTLQAEKAGADVRYVIGDAEEDLSVPSSTGGTLYREPIAIGEEGQLISVKIRAIACGKGYKESSYPTDLVYTVDLREESAREQTAGVSLEPDSVFIDAKDQEAFRNLPNGTGYDRVRQLLTGLQAHVKMTQAYARENDGTTELTADIVWDSEDRYEYEPLNTNEQNFLICGTVRLLDGVDARGKNMRVYLPVTVKAAPKPEPKPAPTPIAMPGGISRLDASVNASAKRINAAWPAGTGAASYRVAWRKAGGGWNERTVSGRSFAITGLKKGGCYEVRVAAVNSAGTGAWSPSAFCLIQKTTVKLKSEKKSFSVKTKKIKKISGYQVTYSPAADMSGAKVKRSKKNSFKVKKLRKKTVYYVRTAPYKAIGGKLYIGQVVTKKVKAK